MKAINFNAEMAKAVLDGRKTQTRRVVKPPHVPVVNVNMAGALVGGSQKFLAVADNGRIEGGHAIRGETEQEVIQQILLNGCCPYGGVGDLIYVREPFIQGYAIDEVGDIAMFDDNDNELLKTFYKATDDGMSWDGDHGTRDSPPWKSSAQMPKELSRITLKITDIRVEQLQDISQQDAIAEGFCHTGWMPSYGDPDSGGDGDSVSAADNFSECWHGLYPIGQKSWEANPWVWVIEFEVIEGGVWQN